MSSAVAPDRRLVGVVTRHPVGSFLAWAFPVSQAIAFQPVLAREWYDVELPTTPFVVAANLLGLLLPALVITRIVDGPAGLRALCHRAVRVQVPLRWYGLALVVVPLATAAIAVALHGPPEGDGWGLASALVSGLLVQLVLVLVTTNWAEEVAWTGFLQTRLQDRHGPVRAAVATGPLFALQHASLAYGNGWLGGLAVLLFVTVTAVPFRFLQGWVANRTGSLFVVGLVHAAGNASTDGSGSGGPGLLPRLYPEQTVGPVHLVASAVLGLVVLLATRARLGRPAASEVPARPGARPGPAGRGEPPHALTVGDGRTDAATATTAHPTKEQVMSKRLTAHVDIQAEPDRVWAVLTDLAAYPEWNPFIVRADGVVEPGRRLTLTMQPVGGRALTLRPRLVAVATGRELRWRGVLGIPGLMDAEHSFVLQPHAGGTRLVQQETFRGVLVPLVAGSLDRKTRPAFVAMNEALRQRVQHLRRAAAGTTGAVDGSGPGTRP